MASEIVYIFHWIIYIISFIAFALLFTRYVRWGAAWIAILFFSQALSHGCLVVDLQNYFRVREGLQPILNGMLTDRFTSNIQYQAVISYCIGLLALIIGYLYDPKTARS